MINPNQSSLKIEPPYGACIVQHLHHVELVYGKSQIKQILTWLQGLYAEAVLQIEKITTETYRPCDACKNGYMLDETRKNEVFPEGVPVMCSVCKGTKQIVVNDIINDEPAPTTERVPTVSVKPDDGTNEIMKPTYEI